MIVLEHRPPPRLRDDRELAHCVAELRALARRLATTLDIAAAAANSWREALASHPDPTGRALGEAAVERALDRHAQLRAVLRRASASRITATTAEVVGSAVTVTAERHPALAVSPAAPTWLARLDVPQALALEVGLLVALSNSGRHAPDGTTVTIRGLERPGWVVVIVEEQVPAGARPYTPRLAAGRGRRLAESLAHDAGGLMRTTATNDGVNVRFELPIARHEAAEAGDDLASQLDLLDALLATAAVVNDAHGFAHPLLEARWLAGGEAGRRLSAALDEVRAVGLPYRQRLLRVGELAEEAATTLVDAGLKVRGQVTGGGTMDEYALHDVTACRTIIGYREFLAAVGTVGAWLRAAGGHSADEIIVSSGARPVPVLRCLVAVRPGDAHGDIVPFRRGLAACASTTIDVVDGGAYVLVSTRLGRWHDRPGRR